MEIERRKFLSDETPRSMFVSAASHAAVRLAMLDCQFAVMTNNALEFRSEFGNLTKFLDIYMLFQFNGMYQVLDSKYDNIIERFQLRKIFQSELAPRNAVSRDLSKDIVNIKTFKEWRKIIVEVLETEADILMPFESKLRAEVSLRMLTQSGKDWEFVFRFIFSKLESHRKFADLASFAYEVNSCLKSSTPTEKRKVLLLVTSSVSLDTLKKLQSVNIDINIEDDVVRSGLHHGEHSEAAHKFRVPQGLLQETQAGAPAGVLGVESLTVKDANANGTKRA
mmetsp:Transcript_8403/g.14964  ORF Transcript_8403/g.14964 Transcript_8403/m.14964 type:complete len:280 (-) Transcript_8403:1521-2360(-)